MALLSMIVRKMTQNKWLELSLLIGLVITVGLVSSIPTYTEAILSRMLVKELEASKLSSYPGTMNMRFTYIGVNNAEQRIKQMKTNEQFMQNKVLPLIPVDLLERTSDLTTSAFDLSSELPPPPNEKKKVYRTSLATVKDLEQHIKLVDGRMPADKPVDGVYEVLVTEKGLNNLHTVLDSVFVFEDVNKTKVRVKPVGIMTKKDDDDLFFLSPDLGGFTNSLVMNSDVLDREFIQTQRLLVNSNSWHIVPKYEDLELRNIDRYLQAAEVLKAQVKSNYHYTLEAQYVEVIERYFKSSENLRVLMWSLNVPVLAMLGLYVFMVSNLITNRQKNEIAVLRSRGAARWQIMLSYLVEYTLLGAVAVAAGPPLGLFLTKVLGSSNGFMSFVKRSGIRVHLNSEVYVYAAAAAVIALIVMLVPVIFATKTTIVGHKQQMARMQQTPFWHKLFLDVIALAVSLYGLRVFHERMKTLQTLGLDNEALHIDPLQFAVPALFILGGGMLLLRVYPYFLRLIYWIGRRWWPPSMYATLIQVGRSSAGYQFLMVFLMMTIATGMFSASAARTINHNSEDRIRYASGADVVLQANWPNDKPPEMPGGGPQQQAAVTLTKPVIHYSEPPFEPYTKLAGVESTAKVLIHDNASYSTEEGSGSAKLIGIDSDEFGQTAWFRDGLLDYSFYDYLNLMAAAPNAVLISKTLADEEQLKAGDTIWVGWEGIDMQPFMVYAVVDYFPTFNPNPRDAETPAPKLIVGSRLQIQTYLSLEPYQVWLKLKPGASVNDLYRDIEDKNLGIVDITDMKSKLSTAKSDPFLMAVNGTLTLGFIISLVISFAGFLLYWTLILRGRMLQNGIMRAMGLSLRQLIGMLTVEQLLTSGAAIVIGLVTGLTTSRLFVPLFQNAFDAKKLVPPFRVMVDPIDSIRIYIFVGSTILIGLAILGYMLSRLKIHQAIKLGED
ncbi:putative ABC transport system permease protein [Paenibacillus catalpae]|uniref:Putative ABC transport system permease protein n=1 Tax=Paenibacillus catalpae TaxID=1045775 RepID=A0A1I2GUN5_9BACL|nr:FtsX-like permease family protein [Paenibacillus catalpae]SFF21654.1 putative ABC transport system permease protein [Paenibacillus catalpae]